MNTSLTPTVKKVGFVLIALLAAASLAWFFTGNQYNPEEDGEGDFEIVSAEHRELDGSPVLMLSFTLPLDAKSDTGKLISVFQMPDDNTKKKTQNEDDEDEEYRGRDEGVFNAEISQDETKTQIENGKLVEGAWVLSENPRLLYFPHIKPETRYVVKIDAGIAAKNGSKIASETRYSIRTAAVSPAFYFASRGVVLPAGQNGGLPVVTVNTPEVDIQFLKVKPEKLPEFLERVVAKAATSTARKSPEENDFEEMDYADYYNKLSLPGAAQTWNLDRLNKLTTSAFIGRFDTEKKPNKRAVTFIPVETIAALKEPGVYIAVMSQPNRFRGEYQTSYFYVSDLGLHVRNYPNSSDAFVSSLTNGKGVSDVDISWLDAKGKVLNSAKTNGEGHAHINAMDSKTQLILAKKGEQLSLIALREPALDLAEFDIGGKKSSQTRFFAYSGRDLYRPGEHFSASIMARNADGKMIAAQPIQALLRRPDGKAQWTRTLSPDAQFAGFYKSPVEIPVDAATGAWYLELRADPAQASYDSSMKFNVEEFLPERMKLDLSDAKKQADEKTWNVDVLGAYLYGAPASGNRLIGVANFKREINPLEKQFAGFFFGNDSEEAKSREELADSELDEEGTSNVEIGLGATQGKDSPFSAQATFSLLESGGRPVIRNITRIVWPAKILVGVRPMFVGSYAKENSTVQFEVIRADKEAKLHAGKALPVRLFRENRHYYWRFDDQRGWNSGFTETDELIQNTRVSFEAGARGKITLPVKYGRYRMEIVDPETGLTNLYRFYAGWSAKGDETQGIRPDRVNLKLDKSSYANGETAKLTITPPHAGEAIISVEGAELLWSSRRSLSGDPVTIDIPVKAEWQRHDLYVNVMVLRKGSGEKETDGATPARALGLIHLPLNREARKLNVALEAPAKMVPDQPLKVKIKVPDALKNPAKNSDKAIPNVAMVTLYAVDVGILNITNFKTPDPFDFFFGKLRYEPDLYDIYGRLIEKMAGKKGKLKWGGDAPTPSKAPPQKVRLVDLFSGPVLLNEKGEAEISLPVPDFNGTLRLMAVVSNGENFGSSEAEVVVAAPLIVELATPRFLSVGDLATLALDVHNLSGSAQTVNIKISNKDGLLFRLPTQNIVLKDKEKKVLHVPIEAGSAIGLTDVLINIDSAAMKLTRTFPLQIQAPTPRQSVVRRFSIEPEAELTVQDAMLSGFLRQTVNASVAISNKPPIDVKNAIRDLLVYPYGCAEQTTSSAYPHVFVDEEAAKQFGLKLYSLQERAEMLDKTFARLAGMQATNGGFSLWGNVSEYQYWLSAYITNFLFDARAQGFNVPEQMEKKAQDFLFKGLQEGVAGMPRNSTLRYDENQVWNDYRYAGAGRFGVLAYGAYVLALNGKAPLATLRDLAERANLSHSGLALVHLGLALRLAGDKDEKRTQGLIEQGIVKTRANNNWWGDYGSDIRDWSLMYVLLNKHNVAVEGRENLVGLVAGSMQNKTYLSTQEKLGVFLLGRQFAQNPSDIWAGEVAGLTGKELVKIGGKSTQFVEMPTNDLINGVQIKNTNKEKLFVELTYSGNPQHIAETGSDNFKLTRTWYNADGTPLNSLNVNVGESLIVRVKVEPKGRFANALLVDYIPAGVEIENMNIAQGEGNALIINEIDVASAMSDARIKHKEFRDDRFVAALRLDRAMNLFYRVRVVTPGKFIVPPTFMEEMYQPMIYGISGGNQLMTISDGK